MIFSAPKTVRSALATLTKATDDLRAVLEVEEGKRVQRLKVREAAELAHQARIAQLDAEDYAGRTESAHAVQVIAKLEALTGN